MLLEHPPTPSLRPGSWKSWFGAGRRHREFHVSPETQGHGYLFQKYMRTGKTDMMAPWKMLRSRCPSLKAARTASF